MLVGVTCGLANSAEKRKESANVFEYSKVPRTEKHFKQLMTTTKCSTLKRMSCPKTIECGIMSDTSVKDAVKTSFKMDLGTVKWTPKNIISELETIKTNKLFKRSNLRDFLCRHASLLDQQKRDRRILLMSEFKDGVDPYQTNNNK